MSPVEFFSPKYCGMMGLCKIEVWQVCQPKQTLGMAALVAEIET